MERRDILKCLGTAVTIAAADRLPAAAAPQSYTPQLAAGKALTSIADRGETHRWRTVETT